MQEAADALRAERVQDAQRAFERVIEALPMHAASSFALALMAAKRGQTIDAARMLKKGLEGDPDYYPALFLLAEIEAGQGQFDEAIAHFKRVVELVGPRREGIEARRRLPALEDASAKMKAIEVGLLAEARKSFNEGIDAFQKQDYETAFKAFGRAMVLDEKNPYYMFNRGLAAFNLGNNLVAAQSFERVLELAPTFGLAHFWLGVMFQASAEQARDAGNLPEAEAEYKAVVDRLTQAITHGEGAWYVEEAEKRLAQAKDFLGRYQENLGFLRIGEVLIVLGRLEEAVTVFSAATQRFQYDFQPWLNIGAVLTDLKRFDDAKAALEQASKVNPKSPKPYIQMGYLFEVQERLPDAAATYRKVIEMAPDQADPHASLGAVLMQMDQPDDAIKAFERAVELSGGTSTPRVHFSLAFLYLQRGQATLALTHYRKTRDLLAGRTEKEAVDIRRTAEDSIATLEERLRPYRFTLRATPWNYDSNIASATTNAVGEAYSQVGGSVSYLLVNEERLKLRGVLDHSETYYLLVLQQMFTATSMLASLDYTLSPVLDVNGAYRWTYSHGTNGPQALSQALSASVTRRGQLPSSMALGLSYGTSSGLGASTVRNASVGYSVSMSQSLAQGATLETSFSATSVDSNRDDQVNQTKNLSIRYSRTLWETLRATLTYGLGLTDFVNPFRVTVPRGDQQVQTLIFLQGTATNIGLNLSRQFRNDVTVSLGMDLQRQQSNFSLDQSEDVNELLNQLVQARGSFRKRTVSLTVTKEF
jgi:tetratricopeptide (TPR) repeat protein